MQSRILVALSLVGILWGCDLKKKQIAQQRMVDSLRNELKVNQKLTEAITEIQTLLDSIDATRGKLRVRMIEGAVYESVVNRMSDLNGYVKKAEDKIAALEKSLYSHTSNNAAYASAIKKLKADLDVRNQELDALKEQVKVYKNENDNLTSTVSLQKAEIEDKLNQINSKQADIAKLQGQVSDILAKSSVDQGEAYFARATATEEIARRTHFAPRKKKNSRKEALELYKMALTFGKDEAQARITALEKKM